jgi:hypothetical protein
MSRQTTARREITLDKVYADFSDLIFFEMQFDSDNYSIAEIGIPFYDYCETLKRRGYVIV